MTTGWLLTSTLAVLTLAAAVGWRFPRLWRVLTLAGSAALLLGAVRALQGDAPWVWRSTFAVGGEPLHLHLDALSALFLAILAVIGAAGCAYAHAYFDDHHRPRAAPRGRTWWSALLASLVLVLTSANGLHFLMAWESFTVCAWFLVTLERERPGVRATGWLYLAASHAAAMALFAFFAGLAAGTGSWDLGPLRQHEGLAPLFWLALFGFGLKAGVFPLHVWLPSAHANAPSHVSAVLSGVTIKLGIYGLVRFSGWLPVPAAAGWVILALGAVSALVGVAFAFAQTDLKRLLAYCSVENVGLILVGVGGALVARADADAAWGSVALAGALLHVWNHAAFKALLFLGAGSVLHATGTRELSRLGGLWKRMPWTATTFAIGALALAGLPPLNGLVGEWLVGSSLLRASAAGGQPAWAAMPAAIGLGLAGALALATALKACALCFLGAPRTRAAAEAHEPGLWMRAPLVGLAATCVLLGVAPGPFARVVHRVVGQWEPAWAAAGPPPGVAALGVLQAVLAACAVLATLALRAWVRANGQRPGPTWDCGFAQPTARMQFSAGSFSGIASAWFAWILRPAVRQRRPRGPFPREALRLERVPETVLERMIVPLGTAVLRVSSAVRRLQHGRLPAYVLYLAAGLVALAVLVAFGAAP